MEEAKVELDLIADDLEMVAEWRRRAADTGSAVQVNVDAAAALEALAGEVRNLPVTTVETRVSLEAIGGDLRGAERVWQLNQEIGFSRRAPSAPRYLAERIALRQAGDAPFRATFARWTGEGRP